MLTHLHIKGFKSLCDAEVRLGRMNVLVGANGAGKSNLIAFFRLLNEMMGQRLQIHIGVSGRAQTILSYGPKQTPQLAATLKFEMDGAENEYSMQLAHAAGDTLVFADETLRYRKTDQANPIEKSLGAGQLETRIGDAADTGDQVAKVFRYLLSRCRVYHFHDTSSTARVRQHCYIGDSRFLIPDAGNLAAVLYKLKSDADPMQYHRIVKHIRLLAPYFDDFDLEPAGPEKKDIILNWKEIGTDQVFGPHQLSDGTLRSICLITLFLQPVDSTPDLIIVDEPELGLHPYALNVIASVMKQAAMKTQVMISTQSPGLLDHFDRDDVVIVQKGSNGTSFSRPDPEALEAWLEEYTLGEIWEKNVFGGGPF